MRNRLRINPTVNISTRTKVMLRSAAIGIGGGVVAASMFFAVTAGIEKFKGQPAQTESAVSTDSLKAMTTLEQK